MTFQTDIKDDIDALLALGELSEPISYRVHALGSLETGLVGRWELEESSGRAVDVSGRGNHLTAVGSVGSKADGKILRARGPFSAANYLRRDLAALDDFDIRGLVSMTALAWVRLAAKTGNQSILEIWSPTLTDQALILRYELASDTVVFHQADGAGGSSSVTAGVLAPAVGTWFLAAGVFDAGTQMLSAYLNGTLVSAAGEAGGFPHSTFAAGLKLGAFTTAGLSGDLDDGMFWAGRALTEAELDTIYGAGDGPWSDVNAFVTPGYADDPNLIGVAAEGLDPPIVVQVSKTDIPTVTELKDVVLWNGKHYHVKRIIDEDAASRRLYCAR
jgi:hypothetical protein